MGRRNLSGRTLPLAAVPSTANNRRQARVVWQPHALDVSMGIAFGGPAAEPDLGWFHALVDELSAARGASLPASH